MHAVDLAYAHILGHQYLECGAPALNLVTGTGSSVLEVVPGLEEDARTTVPNEVALRRPGDPTALWADSSRVKAVFG